MYNLRPFSLPILYFIIKFKKKYTHIYKRYPNIWNPKYRLIFRLRYKGDSMVILHLLPMVGEMKNLYSKRDWFYLYFCHIILYQSACLCIFMFHLVCLSNKWLSIFLLSVVLLSESERDNLSPLWFVRISSGVV